MIKTLTYSSLFFAIDQISKWLILEKLLLNTIGVYEVFQPYLVFKMGWNKGINFGLLSSSPEIMQWVLIILATGICATLLYWSRNLSGRFVPILIGLIIGGAMGNVCDRIRFGAVIDFLNMSCCGIKNPYIFNLADIFIFIGLIPLVLFSDRFQKRA